MTTQTPSRTSVALPATMSGEYDLWELEKYVRPPRTEARFQSLADALVVRVDDDVAVSTPRPQESGDTIGAWLERHEPQFVSHLAELLSGDAPSDDASRATAAQLLRDATIQNALRRHVAERIALRWSARSYPQAAEVGIAYLRGAGWVVPVERAQDRKRIGQIVLNGQGNVQLDESSQGNDLIKEFAEFASR